MKKSLLYIIFLFAQSILYAQPFIQGYTGVGKNNISGGTFSEISILPTYVKNMNYFRTGMNFTFSKNSERRFTGLLADYYRYFNIRSLNFLASAGYRWTTPSEELRELNFIAGLGIYRNKFSLYLGNNTRVYKFSNKYIRNNHLSKGADSRIVEKRNLIYAFNYNIYSYESKWSVSAAVLNFDNFYIEQETNPMFKASFFYSLKSRSKVFATLYMKQAGLMNIKINRFGYFLRLGMEWQIL